MRHESEQLTPYGEGLIGSCRAYRGRGRYPPPRGSGQAATGEARSLPVPVLQSMGSGTDFSFWRIMGHPALELSRWPLPTLSHGVGHSPQI